LTLVNGLLVASYLMFDCRWNRAESHDSASDQTLYGL